jgi:hypothetical protein
MDVARIADDERDRAFRRRTLRRRQRATD